MTKGRIEAFTDAVIAIIMTILVLEIKAPETASLSGIFDLRHKLFAYILSFLLLAVTWNNHHHMFQIAEKINGKVLWGNTFMLFWMSLIPIATAWVGEHLYSFAPEMTYGVIFLMFNFGYSVLTHVLIEANGPDSKIYQTLKGDKKIYVSITLNLLALVAGFFQPILVIIGCFTIPFIWFVPNKRIERLYQ